MDGGWLTRRVTTLPNACRHGRVLTGGILSVSDEAKRRVGGMEGKLRQQ